MLLCAAGMADIGLVLLAVVPQVSHRLLQAGLPLRLGACLLCLIACPLLGPGVPLPLVLSIPAGAAQ